MLVSGTARPISWQPIVLAYYVGLCCNRANCSGLCWFCGVRSRFHTYLPWVKLNYSDVVLWKNKNRLFAKIFTFGVLIPRKLFRSEPNQRRSIAASLIQGVYVLEHDRQQKRINHNALAPIWWQFFDFRLIQMLEDHVDSSIVGAIFEYQSPNTSHHDHKPPESRPPKYVIAFRGSLFKPDTQKRDGQLGAKLPLNRLTHDTRYQTSLLAVQEVISQAGPQNVWLSGHSLGAAIALQIGKNTAREGFLIDTFLFNPPYPSIPIEMLDNPKHKARFYLASSLLTAGLSVALKGTNTHKNSSTTTEHYDPFTTLCTWIPNLFVNQYDPICCGYIGYFEHREKMKSWGVGKIERIAAKDTLISLVSGAFGRDDEALHLIPSAFLVKNLHPNKVEFKIAHGIHQWWAPDPNLQSQTYNFR